MGESESEKEGSGRKKVWAMNGDDDDVRTENNEATEWI